MATDRLRFPEIKKEISDFMFEEEGNIPRNKLLGLSSMILLLSLLYANDVFAAHRSHRSHSSHRSHRNGHTSHSNHYSHNNHNNHSSYTQHYSHRSHVSHTSHVSHASHGNGPSHNSTIISATATPISVQLPSEISSSTATPTLKPTATPTASPEIINIPTIQKPQPNDFTMPEIKPIELTQIPNKTKE